MRDLVRGAQEGPRSTFKKVTGQAVIEYVLMMAVLAGVSLAFASFFNKTLFGDGLAALPGKASVCMSHPVGRGDAGCR